MERIAPLAKILAEANGIDWQKLRGSGEGGMIVEQDILNYLSRIMSGEEEPPATPVDAPPADWTGSIPSADMLKGAGVDSDIAAFVEQSRATPPSVSAMPAAQSLDAEALEFELDDEDLPPATPPVGNAWDWNASAAPEVSAPSIPDVPSSGMSSSGMSSGSVPSPEVSVPSFNLPDISAPQVQVSAPDFNLANTSTAAFTSPNLAASAPSAGSAPDLGAAGGAVSAAGLGSLLSQLYHKDDAAKATPTPQAATSHEPAASSATDFQAPAAPLPSAPELDVPAAGEPELTAPELSVPEINAPSFTAPAGTPDPVLAAPEWAAPQMTEAPAQEMAPSLAEAEHSEPSAPVVDAPAEASAPTPAPSAVHTEPMAEDTPTPAVHEEPAAHPEPAPVAVAPGQQPTEAVWFGTYLRRDADLGPATELRGQLVSALGQDVPLAFLVARAAQRHASALGLSSVALQDGGSQARSVPGTALRDAVSALDKHHDGTPDLLVVDAGALDLDDLHYPQTLTLSVGRVHAGRAALTLNGNVDAAKAAQFLGQVAQTLEQPLVLVL